MWRLGAGLGMFLIFIFWFLQKVTSPQKMTWKLHIAAIYSTEAEVLQCATERTHVFVKIFFTCWLFQQKLSQNHFNDSFCQSLTRFASSLSGFPSVYFRTVSVLAPRNWDFHVSPNPSRMDFLPFFFLLRSVTTFRGVHSLWFTLTRTNHTWSDWCNMIILDFVYRAFPMTSILRSFSYWRDFNFILLTTLPGVSQFQSFEYKYIYIP